MSLHLAGLYVVIHTYIHTYVYKHTHVCVTQCSSLLRSVPVDAFLVPIQCQQSTNNSQGQQLSSYTENRLVYQPEETIKWPKQIL